MSQAEETNERTQLLDPRVAELSGRRRSSHRINEINETNDAASIISSHVSKEEQELAGTAIGERLPYNDYTTIDWLHDLVCPVPVIRGFHVNICFRSRTRSGIELYNPEKVSKAAYLPAGILAKDG
jgi:chloride channel 3/4/5